MRAFHDTIDDARKFAEIGDYRLAVFCLRDIPETKEHGLEDYAWCLYNDDYLPGKDVADFINELEYRMENH